MQDVNKDVIWTALELGWKHDISKALRKRSQSWHKVEVCFCFGRVKKNKKKTTT